MKANEAFRDNPAQSRYELAIGERVAYADYERRPGTLVIRFVFAPPELRGTGAADRLMRAVSDRARDDGVKITPLCGYARSWLKRHDEGNLVA